MGAALITRYSTRSHRSWFIEKLKYRIEDGRAKMINRWKDGDLEDGEVVARYGSRLSKHGDKEKTLIKVGILIYLHIQDGKETWN